VRPGRKCQQPRTSTSSFNCGDKNIAPLFCPDLYWVGCLSSQLVLALLLTPSSRAHCQIGTVRHNFSNRNDKGSPDWGLRPDAPAHRQGNTTEARLRVLPESGTAD
jgi:hypothetical protein